MRRLRRSILSLFLCVALAVNLLVPFAYATPLFVEICAGHDTILIPAPDAADTEPCDTCMVCCISLLPPEERPGLAPATRAASHSFEPFTWPHSRRILHRYARAPPVLTV